MLEPPRAIKTDHQHIRMRCLPLSISWLPLERLKSSYLPSPMLRSQFLTIPAPLVLWILVFGLLLSALDEKSHSIVKSAWSAHPIDFGSMIAARIGRNKYDRQRSPLHGTDRHASEL